MTRFRIFLFVFAFTFFVFAAQPVPAQTVHFIGVADIHSNLSMFVQEDMERICKTLGNGINVKEIEFYLLKDKNQAITPNSVLGEIQRLNVQQQDTVVFYYTGHGAMDAKTNELFYTISAPARPFRLGDKPLFKKDIIAEIQKHQPKLTIIISDCCSVKVQIPLQAGKGWQLPKHNGNTLPIFRSLFFEPNGLVDFTAAQDGDPGLCYPDSAADAGRFGSVLTHCLADQLDKMKYVVQTWGTFFPKIRDASKADAAKYCREKMIPKAFSLGNAANNNLPVINNPPVVNNPPAPPGGRKFGVRAMTRKDGGSGVKITEVVKGLPGAKAGLEVGDVILEIDGKPLRNEEDYSDAVDAAGRMMKIKALNFRNNQIIETEAVF